MFRYWTDAPIIAVSQRIASRQSALRRWVISRVKAEKATTKSAKPSKDRTAPANQNRLVAGASKMRSILSINTAAHSQTRQQIAESTARVARPWLISSILLKPLEAIAVPEFWWAKFSEFDQRSKLNIDGVAILVGIPP
jgi:hypothetical protein